LLVEQEAAVAVVVAAAAAAAGGAAEAVVATFAFAEQFLQVVVNVATEKISFLDEKGSCLMSI
jgi:hypothetical protein